MTVRDANHHHGSSHFAPGHDQWPSYDQRIQGSDDGERCQSPSLLLPLCTSDSLMMSEYRDGTIAYDEENVCLFDDNLAALVIDTLQ